MREKAARFFISLICALFGVGLLALVFIIPQVNAALIAKGLVWVAFAAYPAAFLLFGILAFIFGEKIIVAWRRNITRIDQRLSQMQMADIIFGALGLVIGLIIAFLLSALLRSLPYPLYLSLSLVLYIAFGSVFARVSLKRWHELPFLSQYRRQDGAPSPGRINRAERRAAKAAAKAGAGPDDALNDGAAYGQGDAQGMTDGLSGPEEGIISPAKLLDSSVLIDGRIVDICKCGFLEGMLIVPQFILEELQRVADSAESLKRRRGRRGLDVVAELQRIDPARVFSGGYDEEGDDEVDMKLLKLSRRLNGIVMTNDYNLNKVAELSGVRVLNINELANALKPALLPGEEMTVTVLKEGKEHNQGVAYLEDGTMIVVENGRDLIGDTIPVSVTSVLQTAAGRMIFARPKE